MEEKPEFDLSSLKQEQGQNNGQGTIQTEWSNLNIKTPAPQAKPDSKPDAPNQMQKVADAEDKPSQATTDSQAEQTSTRNTTIICKSSCSKRISRKP